MSEQGGTPPIDPFRKPERDRSEQGQDASATSASSGQPGYGESPYGQYGQYGQPGYQQPGYGEPQYGQYGQYGQPGYQQPGYQPGYQQPGYGDPQQGQYGAPGYPQPGYGQPGYGPYGGYGQAPGYPYPGMPVQQTNGVAIAALVCGILGFFTCGLGGVAAIPLGIVGLRRAPQLAGSGRGMALAGLILGSLAVLAWVVFFVLAAVTGDVSGTGDY